MALHDLPETRSELVREFLRHTSPLLLIAFTVASIGVRVGLGGLGWVDLLIAVGLVAVWPLQEWLIHVFILHYRPVEWFGRTWDFSVPAKHRRHHADPWDLELLFVPLEVYVVVPALIVSILFWVVPQSGWIFSFLTVYFVLSLHYEWVHYMVHTRFRPKSRFYARLWRNHRLHHFKNEQYWYGVTMLSGDQLLRTAPDRNAVATSPTCRNLDAAV